MKMLYPNENNGSQTILTTRVTQVADYASSSNNYHHTSSVNEEENWNLFLVRVFGKGNCPPKFVGVWTRIAKNQGFPLLIVVIGGFLSKVNKAQKYWEDVAETFCSTIA